MTDLTTSSTPINNIRRLSDYMGTQVNNIILVASGKGGVGKTWFTISMAHLLAKKSRKVLIVDGDLGLANIDIQLGVLPPFDIGSLLEGKAELKDIIYTHKETGIDILAGRSGSGSLSQLNHSQLSLLRHELQMQALHYDWVFIDLGAGIGGTVRSLASMATSCYLIINDEPTSLTDGYAFLKVMRHSHPKMDFNIVINQVESYTLGEDTFNTFSKACERFINYQPTLSGIIKRDPLVKDSIRNQTSTIARFPNSDVVKDVKKAIKKLMR